MTDDEKRAQLVSSGRLLKKSGAFAKKEEVEADAEEESSEEDSLDEDWEWEEFVSPLSETMGAALPSINKPEETETEEDNLTSSQKLSKARKMMQKQQYKVEVDPSTLRAPVVCILGHVDTGKTTLLDTLRSSNIAAGEAGGITQQIGATMVFRNKIIEKTEEINVKKFDLFLEGLLFIDTPGHESFSNMRVRGSSLCDVAVLMVDLMNGLQGQTIESLKMVNRSKTKFVIGLNKCDLISEWVAYPGKPFQYALKQQTRVVQDRFAERLALVRGQLVEHGVFATPYWRVKDLALQSAIIPMSAKDTCGVPDLLMFLMLFSQTVLTTDLTKTSVMKCNVLEVNQAPGLGVTIDVLLVNGEISCGDKIMFGGIRGPVTTTVRNLITTKEGEEMKQGSSLGKASEHQATTVKAVRGVKIWAKGLDTAVAGCSVYVVKSKDDPQVIHAMISGELDQLRTKLSKTSQGVHVQASSLGSLEALMEFLNENGVPIGSFGIGTLQNVHNRGAGFGATCLCFDVAITRQARKSAVNYNVDIIEGNVIYQLFEEFKRKKRTFLAKANANKEPNPCVLAIEPSLVIKTYNPITIGVHVQCGSIEVGTRLYTIDKTIVGDIDTIHEATSNTAMTHGVEGMLYIIKITNTQYNLVYGRDFFDDDKFFTLLNRRKFGQLCDRFEDYPRKLITKYAGFLQMEDVLQNAATQAAINRERGQNRNAPGRR